MSLTTTAPMPPTSTPEAPMATARFNHADAELDVPFRTALEQYTPATIEFSTPLRLTADDLWAALWCAAAHGLNPSELTDPHTVRMLVADQLVNGGLFALDEAHATLSTLTPGTFSHQWATQLRDAAHHAFAEVMTR